MPYRLRGPLAPPMTQPESRSSTTTPISLPPVQPALIDVTTISSNFISPSVHHEVITHFSVYPPRHITNEFSSAELLFSFYWQGFCQTNIESPTPPPLRDVIEDYLLFYVRKLNPYYFARRGSLTVRPAALSSSGLVEPRYDFLRMLTLVGGWSLRNRISFVAKRWQCGMLRERHVRILKTVMRALLVELETLLDLDAGLTGEGTRLLGNMKFGGYAELKRSREIARVCKRACTSMEFFASSRFRSERLEILLCRYFDEADRLGPNLQVARGIDAEDKRLEDEDNKISRA